jgi:hypothetical protein
MTMLPWPRTRCYQKKSHAGSPILPAGQAKMLALPRTLTGMGLRGIDRLMPLTHHGWLEFGGRFRAQWVERIG